MCAAEHAAILPDEDEHLFAALADCPALLVAVSGGADSSALLYLLARWRAARTTGPRLFAATVDHRLRPRSGAEAAAVKALAGRLGIAHRTLRWSGEKPATGIQAAARAARYRLLAGEAHRVGAAHVVLAHTLDDQAETVLLRLAAGSGPAGLAGMRPMEARAALTLCRPLLGVRKQRLVATLRAAGLAWAEDPSNADARFARPRLRQAAAALAREGLTPERLARLAARLRRYEEAVAAGAVQAEASLRRDGASGRLDGGAMIRLPEELALRVLAGRIAAAGGEGGDAPRLARLEALWREVGGAVAGGRRLRRTLAEAVISVDADGAIAIAKAPPRRPAGRPQGARQGEQQGGRRRASAAVPVHQK